MLSALNLGIIFEKDLNFPINFIFKSLSLIIDLILSTKEISFLLIYNFSKESK